LYVTLYSLALAELRICPNDGLLADAEPVAAAVDVAALVAAAPVAVVPVGLAEPPHDAAITNANARTAALPLFTTLGR
jgi:hypothetical protein